MEQHLLRNFRKYALREVIKDEILSNAASTLEEFDSLTESDFCVFFEPPSLDDRIVNQFALFSLMSNSKARLADWLSNHPDLFFIIGIPSSLNWEIRDKLDQVIITERVLFPGLDGLSTWLRIQYSPRI